MVQIATTIDEALSAEWLSTALSDRYPGTVVEDVEVSVLLHGVGTKALIRLTYGGEGASEVQRELCVKAGFEPHNQHLLEGGTYLKEARFYREVAEQLPITVPRCYFAGYDEDSLQGILILEDLRASGATFGSAQRGNSVEEAARFLDALAALHARFWGGALSNAHPWISGPDLTRDTSALSRYTDGIQSNLEDSRGETLPSSLLDASKLVKGLGSLPGIVGQRPLCLTHGDPHAGNLYLAANGDPGFYDWQTVNQSWWATDVAYYLAAALSHEDRHRSIRDLLQHYLDRLAAHGAAAPSWDEAWLSYRQFLIYGFFLWSITRPVVQPIEVITTFIDRIGQSMVEADTYEALGI